MTASQNEIAKDLATGTASNLMDILASFTENTGGVGSKAVASMFKLSAITINLVTQVPNAGDTSQQIVSTGKVLTTYFLSEAVAAGALATVGSKLSSNPYVKATATIFGGLVGWGAGFLYDGITEVKQDGTVIQRGSNGKEIVLNPDDVAVFKDYASNKSISISYDINHNLKYISVSDISGNKGYKVETDGTITAYDKQNGILSVTNINNSNLPTNAQNIINDIAGEIDYNLNLSSSSSGLSSSQFYSNQYDYNQFGTFSKNSFIGSTSGLDIGTLGDFSISAKNTQIKQFADGSSLTSYYDPTTGKSFMLVTGADGKYTFYYPDSTNPAGISTVSFYNPSELPFAAKGLFDSFIGNVTKDLSDEFSQLPTSSLPKILDLLPDPLEKLVSPDILLPNKLLPSWLAPPVGMQQGNGGVQFPAGNGGGAEPLILDLNGDGARSTRLGYGAGSLSTTYFDMDNDGFAERTAWVASGDGLLVMDKNGNGKIDNQTELFGNTATYANGFLNLKQYDSNSDNKITSADADGYYLTQSPQRHTEFTENSVSNDNHKNGGVIVRRMDAMRLAG